MLLSLFNFLYVHKEPISEFFNSPLNWNIFKMRVEGYFFLLSYLSPFKCYIVRLGSDDRVFFEFNSTWCSMVSAEL